VSNAAPGGSAPDLLERFARLLWDDTTRSAVVGSNAQVQAMIDEIDDASL
jgi:hypothetical protein